jgi:hypothetical protein
MLIYVVTSSVNPGITDVFKTEEEAIAHIRDWFPDYVQIGCEFFRQVAEHDKQPIAAYYMRRLED